MEQSGFPLLSLYIFAPVLGMAAVLCIPSKRGDIIKTVASAAAAVPLIIGAYLFFAYKDTGAIKYYESHEWIGFLKAYYKVGMDGLSAPMLVLSGLVGFIAVVASWGIEKQVKGYFALILLLLMIPSNVCCREEMQSFELKLKDPRNGRFSPYYFCSCNCCRAGGVRYLFASPTGRCGRSRSATSSWQSYIQWPLHNGSKRR